MYRIHVGQKAYSSWSMRGWLLLAGFGLPFEEVMVRITYPEFEAMQREKAPVRTVPFIEWEERGQTRTVWDSLAIAETLAERHPEAGIWPSDLGARTVARSLASEMHSGFGALRSICPMNLHRIERPLADPPTSLGNDLARLADLWRWAPDKTGGPWLGGPRFSAVDAFYAPVATRLESYGLLTPAVELYARRLLAHPAVARWIAEGRASPDRMSRYDVA